MAGGKERRSLSEHGSQNGLISVLDVDLMARYLDRWCLRGRGEVKYDEKEDRPRHEQPPQEKKVVAKNKEDVFAASVEDVPDVPVPSSSQVSAADPPPSSSPPKQETEVILAATLT
jgi:hypothetical protein